MLSTFIVPTACVHNDEDDHIGHVSLINGVWQSYDPSNRLVGTSKEIEDALNILANYREVYVKLPVADAVVLAEMLSGIQESVEQELSTAEYKDGVGLLNGSEDEFDDLVSLNDLLTEFVEQVDDAVENIGTLEVTDELVGDVLNRIGSFYEDEAEEVTEQAAE